MSAEEPTTQQVAARLSEPAQGTRAARWRLGTAAIDQALCGGSNVVALILAARTLSVHAFGLFSIVYLIYVLAQSTARAMVCEPLLVHPQEASERPRDALGSALVVGTIQGALLALVGLGLNASTGGGFGSGLVALGLCFPLLSLQDVGRYLAFATRKPGFAVALDLTWLVVMVGAVAWAAASTDLELIHLVGAWAGAGAAAGTLTMWRYRGQRVRLSLSWLRETWTFSWRYLLSIFAGQVAALTAATALAAISGAAALGGVRGALLLVRPSMTVHISAISSGVSEIAFSRPNQTTLRRQAARISALVSGIAVINLAAMLLLPNMIGQALLGGTWDQTKGLLLPAGTNVVLVGLWTGARVGLLGLRAVKTTLRLDLYLAPIIVLAAAVGAQLGGGRGYYWGVVACQALITVVWWARFWRHTSTVQASASVTAATSVGDSPTGGVSQF